MMRSVFANLRMRRQHAFLTKDVPRKTKHDNISIRINDHYRQIDTTKQPLCQPFIYLDLFIIYRSLFIYTYIYIYIYVQTYIYIYIYIYTFMPGGRSPHPDSLS